MRIHQNIRVTGRVQGVGFRFFTKRKAVQLGLTGLVKNKPDGSVYLEAEGEKNKLDKLVDWLRQGPPLAKVTKIKATNSRPKNFKAFVIEK
jgi:acylphosphatase